MASKTKTKNLPPLHLNVSYVWATELSACTNHPWATAYFEMKKTKRKMCLACVADWETSKNK